MGTCAVVIAVVLVVTMSGIASGQQVKTEVELLPGGQTFGGPGAVKGLPRGERRTLITGEQLPVPLCVTLVNVGGSAVTLRVALKSASAPQNASREVSVRPGHTETFCQNTFDMDFRGFAPTDVEAECPALVIGSVAGEKQASAGPGGVQPFGACSFLWRADNPRF